MHMICINISKIKEHMAKEANSTLWRADTNP